MNNKWHGFSLTKHVTQWFNSYYLTEQMGNTNSISLVGERDANTLCPQITLDSFKTENPYISVYTQKQINGPVLDIIVWPMGM